MYSHNIQYLGSHASTPEVESPSPQWVLSIMVTPDREILVVGGWSYWHVVAI